MRVYTSSQLEQISRRNNRNAAASFAGGGLYIGAVIGAMIYFGFEPAFKAVLWLLG